MGDNEMDGRLTPLLDLVQTYDWPGVLNRLASYPEEAGERGPQGRSALHFACDHDAPPGVVKVLLAAFPEASSKVGTSNMNPLHITCSSPHASVHVVKVLLDGSPTVIETSMRDVDGDTPLHAACRCGAPREVLEVLLKANPSVVSLRDYEQLTPLLRMWVRYFVTLGDDVIDSVRGPDDLVGDLGEAWEKTKLLLKVAHHGSLDSIKGANEFLVVHAAAAVDCPRSVLKMSTILHPEQLEMLDDQGRSPLLIAATAPIYKVHDLSVDGYNYEQEYGLYGDAIIADNNDDDDQESENDNSPSVIEILLDGNPETAHKLSKDSRLPLNIAIEAGKGWNEGLISLLVANPNAVNTMDIRTRLYPFMLAASQPNPIINNIFSLLIANPELIRGGIRNDEGSQGTKSDTTEDGKEGIKNITISNLSSHKSCSSNGFEVNK